MASLRILFLVNLVLLAVVIQMPDAAPFGTNMEDSICCQDYMRHPLPSRVVKEYFWTSKSCRKPGVVLITIKNRDICADPRMHWVKRLLHKLA